MVAQRRASEHRRRRPDRSRAFEAASAAVPRAWPADPGRRAPSHDRPPDRAKAWRSALRAGSPAAARGTRAAGG